MKTEEEINQFRLKLQTMIKQPLEKQVYDSIIGGMGVLVWVLGLRDTEEHKVAHDSLEELRTKI